MFARSKEKDRESNNRMESEGVEEEERKRWRGGTSWKRKQSHDMSSLYRSHFVVLWLFFPESEHFTGRH